MPGGDRRTGTVPAARAGPAGAARRREARSAGCEGGGISHLAPLLGEDLPRLSLALLEVPAGVADALSRGERHLVAGAHVLERLPVGDAHHLPGLAVDEDREAAVAREVVIERQEVAHGLRRD